MPSFDPSQFNDPVAVQTEWTPLKGGGTNFRTHNLIKVSDRKMEFSPSTGTRLFSGFLMGFGLSIPVYHHQVQGVVDASYGPFLGAAIAWGFGGLFFWVGLRFWMRLKGKCVFDKSTGRFLNDGQDYRVVSLDELHAIQLIRERMTSSDSSVGSSSRSSFTSYELNLVLHDGRRAPVMDHSDRRQIRDDAEKLGEFLGVPVWDSV